MVYPSDVPLHSPLWPRSCLSSAYFDSLPVQDLERVCHTDFPVNSGPLPPPGVHNHGRRLFSRHTLGWWRLKCAEVTAGGDPAPRHVTWYRSLLQVCRKELASSGSTNALRRNEPSRSWMEPFQRAPQSRSPLSSLTIRVITTRPSHPLQHIWHLKLAGSADRFTTRRGASGTFHCHHYPGTWLSQLQFISNVFFTTSFSPFCCRYFPFGDFLFVRFISFTCSFSLRSFCSWLVVYVTCLLHSVSSVPFAWKGMTI